MPLSCGGAMRGPDFPGRVGGLPGAMEDDSGTEDEILWKGQVPLLPWGLQENGGVQSVVVQENSGTQADGDRLAEKAGVPDEMFRRRLSTRIF